MSTKCQQTSVMDALRSIPITAMLDVHTPNPLGVDSQHFAIGNICHAAADRIAELEAANPVTLLAALDASIKRETHLGQLCGEAASRIAELEAALADAIKRAEAAEKDTERYRWIRDQCTWGDIYIAIGRDRWMTPGHIICGAADRAIDAAIAKEGER